MLQKEVTNLDCELRPKQFADAMVLTMDGPRVRCDFKPLCMRVKEKAAARKTSLYIAIEGRVEFAEVDGSQRAVTFASSAAYFREVSKTNELEHVHALHYDHVPTDGNRVDFGHPTYHCQTKSMDAKVDIVNASYHTKFGAVPQDRNFVRGLLSNVRMPSAYMDPFCVILQILGDHVVNDESSRKEQESFQRSRIAISKVLSSVQTASMLESALAEKCLRATHWYPAPVDEN